MEMNQPELKEISSNQENSNLKKTDTINEDYSSSNLKDIFIYKKIDEKIYYLPILSKTKNLGKKLKSIFAKQNFSIKKDLNSYKTYITNKIIILIKIKEIIGNSFEIMEIVINFLAKNNIYLINDIIDLYIEIISCKIFEKDIDKNNAVLNIKNILNWFLICGLLNKKHTDYIFQQLAKFQLDKKLTPKLFNSFLSLIELIYGKEYYIPIKPNIIAKNYIYFYDKENSMIKTNITKLNNIYIKESCSIILWFYMNQEENSSESTLCRINFVKGQDNNHNMIDFILNSNKDIEIKLNSILLKELDGKKFEMKNNLWTQLKIQLMKNSIKLNISQNFENVKKEDNSKECNEIKGIIKYETKFYQLNNKNTMNSNGINLELNDITIIDLSFFINFLGYIGTIIFCKNDNPSEVPIKSLYGLKSNKISDFIKEIALSDIFFILSPSLYIKEKNKFVYMNNNITGEIEYNSLDSLEEEEIKDKIDYNNVFNYSKFINNIYQIGGSINLLPLFEIFYKFSKNYDENEKNNILLENIFYKLFQLLELVIVDKPKNYLDIYYNNNNAFFQSLQLFLENINEKFYRNDNIITILLNIGKYVFNYCKEKENDLNNIKIITRFNYFKFILFYPTIVLKFSLEQQNKIWNFFENVNIIPKKVSKTSNISGINLSFCKKCFIPLYQLNNFILLFNKKYPNEYLSPDLINIIKYIFLVSDTSDLERESLFLLINNENKDTFKNRISDKIIISIIEIFTFYLDSAKSQGFSNTKMTEVLKLDKNDKNESFLNPPKLSLEYFLNSENYFIENLLRIISTNNLKLKVAIINLIKIISLKYVESLKNYFQKVETEIKKSRKIKKIHKVSGQEFYHFIQENISPNPNNENIREKQKLNEIFNQNKMEEDKERRKSSMDSLNLINKTIENNNNQIGINNNNNINNQIKQNENYKNIIKRSKTPEEKKIDEIKNQFFQKAKDNINIPRRTEFNFSDNRISSPYEINSQNKITKILTVTNPINIFSEKEDEEEEKNDKNEDLVETQNIAMNLFQWLMNCESIKNYQGMRKSSGNIILSSNIIYDKNSIIDFNFSEIIINYLLKLFYSKNLEVINKILLLIIGHKCSDIPDKNNIQSINKNYAKLLDFFTSSKTKFIQFLEELTINSYLCIYHEEAGYKFNFIKDSTIYLGLEKNKEEYFNEIYNESKDILIDIYFYENNLNNNIIDEIFNIILSLYDGLKKISEFDDENIKIKNILFKFLQEFLNSIIDIYNSRLDYYKKISKNTTSNNNEKYEKKQKKYNEMKKKYACLLNFIFEYIFLLSNSNNFISKTISNDLSKIKNFVGIPDYLIYEIDKDGNKKKMLIKLDMYFKIYERLIDNFNIEKILENINSPSLEKKGSIEKTEKKDKNRNEKYKRDIYYLEPRDINKFLKEYSNNKETKAKLKEILNLLFLSHSDEFKDLPLIVIITILNNYYISTKVEEKLEQNTEEGFHLTSFLNSHMKFILTIIVISFVMKENENYNLNKSYKEIQEIIFDVLLYNINNIINCFNSNFGECFVEILANIMTLISCLWVEDKEHKSLFNLNKNKPKNIVKRVLNYYSSRNKNFFDNPIFEKIASQNVIKNREMISSDRNNIYESIFKSNIEDKTENLPAFDIFNINNYQNIYISRQFTLNHKLKLLIVDDFDKSDYNNENEKEKDFYENILYKVDKLKVLYDNNEIYRYCFDLIKRKSYRKIKKRLYSWNNSFSNLEAFYKKEEKEENKCEKFIKYKISNYLSSDLTRKFIVPIYDIDYYMPKFQIFNYKDSLFNLNEKTQINQYENIYKMDLKIFPEKINIESKVKSKFYSFNVCYIKATHHIRGKIFYDKKLSKNNIKYPFSLLEPVSSFFFIESNITDNELLRDKFEDYDSESKTCFISIFKNNQNPKDSEIFLKLDFSSIIFIFTRKYCFRNNSLEIFLSNHRSYYFKFFDTKERDNFLSELILILNKNNQKNKLFKPIKSIDENNKTIIIGYFKDEEKYKEYSSISNIRELWKNNKISTLEYLMWINIYGNRSFRDTSQYPVFPWLLINHEFNKFDDNLKNFEFRNFNYPMGLLSIDEKGKKRQEGYIETYKMMVMNLTEENLLNIKIKEDEDIIEQPTPNNKNIIAQRKSMSNNLNNNNNINEVSSPANNSTRTISTIFNNNINQNLINLSEQIQDKYIPKIPDYKFDIEKLYGNINFEYEKIPYFYGSHFSNSMYVSHYLMRIFPYCLNMIEIQKKGFDVPERLFINLHKSFYTSISDKGDLREIVPEFFTLPEMFLNINELNFGEININAYKKLIFDENEEESEEKTEKVKVNEVIMPSWCENSPFIFSEKYRKILESHNLNINPWIDLIFGFTQRGIKAQKAGNLYLPYSYDGVMNLRLTKEMILNNRAENEFQVRYFEMGVHPTKVFEKKNKILKNKINNQFIDIVEKKQIIIPEIRLKKLNENNFIIGNTKKIIFFDSYLDEDDEFFILDNNFIGQKISIQESKESEKIFYVKENILYKEFPLKDYIKKNIQNRLIIKSIFKNKYFIIAGYFDGSLYIVKMPGKLPKKEEIPKILEKPYYINEEIIIKKFDSSLITALEVDKNEKFLIYGTMNGSIVIYYLSHFLFKENRNFIEFRKIFKSHNGYPISSISINTDLNVFADCSIDGYVNIYTLSSTTSFRIINSIYIPNPFIPHYVFLSAQPLPSIVLYSNDLCQFKCFSINGNYLSTSESDTNLMSNKFKEYYVENEQNMNSPLIFTDSLFNDYLIYIFKKKYVLIREFPSMKMKIPFNPTLDNHNEELCSLYISEDKKYLYVLEQKCNKIYIINQKFFGNNNSK